MGKLPRPLFRREQFQRYDRSCQPHAIPRFCSAVTGTCCVVMIFACSNPTAPAESASQTAQQQPGPQETSEKNREHDESLKVMVDDAVLYGAVSEASEATEPMLTARLSAPRHEAPFTMQVELFEEHSRCKFTMARSHRKRPILDVQFRAGTAEITRFGGLDARCLAIDPSDDLGEHGQKRQVPRYCRAPDETFVIHGFSRIEDFDLESEESLQQQATELSQARVEVVKEKLEGTIFEDVEFVRFWGLGLRSYERDPIPPKRFASMTVTGATVTPVDSNPEVSMVSAAPAADDEILAALVELRAKIKITQEFSGSFHSPSLRVNVREDIAERYGLEGDREFVTTYGSGNNEAREFVSWIRDFIDFSCDWPIRPPTP